MQHGLILSKKVANFKNGISSIMGSSIQLYGPKYIVCALGIILLETEMQYPKKLLKSFHVIVLFEINDYRCAVLLGHIVQLGLHK